MFVPVPAMNASGLRVAVVVSRYHEEITNALADGAREAFLRFGGEADDLLEVAVPGSFELPAVCAALAHDGEVDAIVALGCIVTGETRHDEYIARAVADGLVRIGAETGVPVAFGVLTVATLDQARARAGTSGKPGKAGNAGAKTNKGEEAMAAAIGAVLAIHAVTNGPIGPGGIDG